MTKLLVVCHKQAELVHNETFLPIRVGAALASDDWSKDILNDNDGENISAKNPTYNELTAIYWAYKNYQKLGDPDNIGVVHYRRYFVFEKRKYAYYEQKTIGENILNDIKAENLDSLLADCDFAAPMPNVRKSVYQNYCSAHHKDDIDLAINIIAEQFPHMSDAAKHYIEGKAAFFYNMFIFKKADFFDYCDFVFAVMGEYEKQTAHPKERFFISEVLTGIYFTFLIENGKKPLLLPVLYIGKKQSFKQAVAECKSNFKDNKSGFLFKIKPLIVFFTPNFLLLKRKRKTIKI